MFKKGDLVGFDGEGKLTTDFEPGMPVGVVVHITNQEVEVRTSAYEVRIYENEEEYGYDPDEDNFTE